MILINNKENILSQDLTKYGQLMITINYPSFGFEIYAEINAYSRYISWSHVGIPTRTKISIYQQYLDINKDINIMPSIIRFDRGLETPIIAQVHFQLWLGDKDERNEMTKKEQEKAFRKFYYYRTSTLNQQIESWWGQLSKWQLFQ